MSKINDDEPKPWHDADGRHRMTDPRKIKDRDGFDSYPSQFWNADEREYAAHLAEHEEQERNPQPEEGDDELVQNLFATIRLAESAIQAKKLLIVALRQQEKGKQS